MKYWKVHTKPRQIYEVSYDALDEAINYQYEQVVMGRGVYLFLSHKAQAFVRAIKDGDYSEETINKAWEVVSSEIESLFNENGILNAGEWTLVKTTNDVGLYEMERLYG